MVLISGIVCLVVSIILLIQIKKTPDMESNQFWGKFLWIYWSLITLVAVNHIISGVTSPKYDQIIAKSWYLVSALQALSGMILAAYLSRRRQTKIANVQ